jgi:predicted transcriptional regulator
MAYFEQPLRKLLGVLAPTITYLSEKGSIDVNKLPQEHLEPIKQLERIGVVHKRNNRLYELQKIRLKKLMDSMGITSLSAIALEAEALPQTPAETIDTDASPVIVAEPEPITAPLNVVPETIIENKVLEIQTNIIAAEVTNTPVANNIDTVHHIIGDRSSLK